MLFNDDTGKNYWAYLILGIDTGKFDTTGFDIIDFEGGYYATATAIDPDDSDESLQQTIQEVKDWVNQSKFFELDFVMSKNRCFMSNMPLGDHAKEAMDYAQLEIFIPIKRKK
jgi:predicted transcriptional regulator YdeE